MRLRNRLLGIVFVGLLGILAGCGKEQEKYFETSEEVPAVTGEAVLSGVGADAIDGQKDMEETDAKTSLNETEEILTETEPVYGELPLILIETENGTGVTDDEVYTNCTVSLTNCEAEYELDSVTAGIRWRGNSTQMYEKKPYRIKFKEKQRLLGLSEKSYKSWVLLAEFNDPSLLRNLITYHLAAKMEGISYVTGCELVEVYLDGEYSGMYLLAEQTQVADGRIALDESGVKDIAITDTGYLLELEADKTRRNEEGAEGEAWFAVTGYADEEENTMQMLMERSFDETAAYYVIKSDARAPEQVKFIQEYMVRVYDAVYQDKSRQAVEALVDLPSAVDMYLVQLIGNDYDNNYSSMFVYKDAGKKLMFGAPWDFDLAYGNFNGYTEAEDTVYVYHLLRQLGEYDWFKTLAAERYRELSKEDGPIPKMRTEIIELTNRYAKAFEREYARWRKDLVSIGNFGNFENWEMPEGFEGFGTWEMPEGTEGFGDFGNWGNFGNWEMPEGFGGFGTWEMSNFSYGAVYDTHAKASEALLAWLDIRLAWIERFLVLP